MKKGFISPYLREKSSVVLSTDRWGESKNVAEEPHMMSDSWIVLSPYKTQLKVSAFPLST